jgi:hypothetical protein
MKILSRSRAYIALAALGILALVSFRAFGQRPTPTQPPEPPTLFVLKIKNVAPTKINQKEFEEVLDTLETQLFDLYTYDENGECRHHTYGTPGHAKHERCSGGGTTSNAPGTASNDPSATLTYIQHRTTIQVPATSVSDIKKVVDTLR